MSEYALLENEIPPRNRQRFQADASASWDLAWVSIKADSESWALNVMQLSNRGAHEDRLTIRLWRHSQRYV